MPPRPAAGGLPRGCGAGAQRRRTGGQLIGHDAVGDHAQPAKALVEAHVFDEFVFLFVAEDELPVHHPRNAVVVGDRQESGSFEAWPAHGDRMGNVRV